MRAAWTIAIAAVLLCAGVVVWHYPPGSRADAQDVRDGHALKSVLLETSLERPADQATDEGRWRQSSASVQAQEDMHVVAFSHYSTGVVGAQRHALSLTAGFPWAENGACVAERAAGCIGWHESQAGENFRDTTVHEQLPAGTYWLVPAGATLYLHAEDWDRGAPWDRWWLHRVMVYYW